MHWSTVIAYYPTDSGTVICPECAEGAHATEELDNPEMFGVAFLGAEVDYAQHCDVCGDEIDGYSILSEEMEPVLDTEGIERILRGALSPSVAVWIDEYGDECSVTDQPALVVREESGHETVSIYVTLDGGDVVIGGEYVNANSLASSGMYAQRTHHVGDASPNYLIAGDVIDLLAIGRIIRIASGAICPSEES